MTVCTTIAAALATIPQEYFWLIGKGRVRSDEPLYAVQIMRPATNDVIAEAEHDDLPTCIAMAVAKLPPACGVREHGR